MNNMLRKLMALVLALALLAGAAVLAEETVDIQALYDQATASAQQGDTDAALALLDEAIWAKTDVIYSQEEMEQIGAAVLEWLEPMAEQGNVLAQRLLADYYWQSAASVEDYDEIVKWYALAMQQGDAHSMYYMALLYSVGYGVEQDRARSMELMQLSAALGYVEAQRMMGDLAWQQGDYEEAAQWYLAAAEQKDTQAQYTLAFMYENGYGVPQDIEAGMQWLMKAAEQGENYAQYMLGLFFVKGELVEQDYEQAAYWFTMGAEQGYADSQAYLASLYYDGLGVDKDVDQAIYWWAQAAEQGHEIAQGNLEALGVD